MSAETRSPSASPSANSSDSDASPANKNSAADGKPKKCPLQRLRQPRGGRHEQNCTNQVYARKLCVRHGGKKQCQADNCEAHARGGGFCPSTAASWSSLLHRRGLFQQAHARRNVYAMAACRVKAAIKTAQHSGSICFRHAMELRAHGEEVPELNISKGGRLSSKKRQQQQREQQMKQEQFHHQQIQQQIHAPQHMQPHPLSIQNQQQSNPFGLPLKINVPTTMPKFSLRTPLGNSFPTPRSHEFSLLMGLPSPQIDNSQLPSPLQWKRTPGLDSFLASGPPSVSRGNGNYLSLGLFPTPRLTDRTPGGAEDAMMSDYIKLMGPEHAHELPPSRPLRRRRHAAAREPGNVFEHNQNNQNNANNAPRNHMAAMAAAAAVHGNSQQRMKMDFLSPRGLAAHNFQARDSPPKLLVKGWVLTRFFVDNKNDKTRGHMKTSSVSAATTPTQPTGHRRIG
ncbi:hypothetical protein GQ600_6440 [Phytophthora cactorum]|nr:hypothetical protein GQ600_6440 [Phytophthora cactorum]